MKTYALARPYITEDDKRRVMEVKDQIKALLRANEKYIEEPSL